MVEGGGYSLSFGSVKRPKNGPPKQHFDVPVTCHGTDTQHDGMYLLNKISLFGLVLKAYITFMTGFFSTELKNVLVLLPPIMIFFSSVITFIYLFIYLFITI